MEDALLQLFLKGKAPEYMKLHRHGVIIPQKSHKAATVFITGALSEKIKTSEEQLRRNSEVLRWLKESPQVKGGSLIEYEEDTMEVLRNTRKAKAFALRRDCLLEIFVESCLMQQGTDRVVKVFPDNTLFLEDNDSEGVLNRFQSWLYYKYGVDTETGVTARGKLIQMFQSDTYVKRGGEYVKGMMLRTYDKIVGLHLLPTSPEEILTEGSFLFWDKPEYKGVRGFTLHWKDGALEGYALLGEDKVRIDPHAFVQFRERFSGKKKDKALLLELISLLKNSREVTRANRFQQLLKHGGREAVYRSSKGWIFVIELHTGLKTCYHKGNIEAHGYQYKSNQNEELHRW